MPAADDLANLHEPAPDWFKRAFAVERHEDTADCEGVPVHYFRWGDPSLPGVVLTHGFMAHARCWAFIAPLLAQRYCLVAYDLSGMGDSGWRGEYDVAVRSLEARAVAQHAGLTEHGQQPALVCHSYGGSVGMHAVESNPKLWSALLVCDMTMVAPGGEFQFDEQRAKRMQRGVRPHRVSEDLSSALARFRLAPDQPCANTFLMEYMAHHSLKQVEGGWVWKFDPQIMGPDMARDPDWWESLIDRFANLQIPRGIIFGERSQMFSHESAAYISANASDTVPMVPIPGAYHHIMLDEPIAFAATIDTMLQSLGVRQVF